MDTLPFTDDDIVHLCQHYRVLQLPLLSHELSGRRVVRLSDGIIVKFGLGVTQQEASAQQLASKHVDRDVLRIPQVYRFFERPDSLFWKAGCRGSDPGADGLGATRNVHTRRRGCERD